jgi:hypothetical protein
MRTYRRPCAIARACLWCLLAGAIQVHAAPAGWVAVDAAVLGELRGGLSIAGGLEVSLGIERIVTINGEVQSRTSFQLTDIARLSEQQTALTRAALSDVKLIQNGSANMALAALADTSLGGTIIQNSLSGQHIDTRTLINASVNSMGLLKAINFNGNVSDAIARAAGPR